MCIPTYLNLITRDQRAMNSTSCSIMIHCATWGKFLLFAGPLFFHPHHDYVGKVISKTPSSNLVLLISGHQWQHLFYCVWGTDVPFWGHFASNSMVLFCLLLPLPQTSLKFIKVQHSCQSVVGFRKEAVLPSASCLWPGLSSMQLGTRKWVWWSFEDREAL